MTLENILLIPNSYYGLHKRQGVLITEAVSDLLLPSADVFFFSPECVFVFTMRIYFMVKNKNSWTVLVFVKIHWLCLYLYL